MSEKPGYTDLEMVYEGPHSEAIVLQASLAASGYPTFLPDGIMKAVDPFITGANPLGARLLAPVKLAEEIRNAIRRLQSGEMAISEDDDGLSEIEEK